MVLFWLQYAGKCFTLQQIKRESSMAAKNRITVNLDDAEYQALASLSQRFDVSLAWLGRRALADLIEKYSKADMQLPIPFPEDQDGGNQQ